MSFGSITISMAPLFQTWTETECSRPPWNTTPSSRKTVDLQVTRRMHMRKKYFLAAVAAPAVILFLAAFDLIRAEGSPDVALSGQVTSMEEGPMEGVLVSAKKAGSTITFTVVTDQQGRYRFPSAKLPAGQYTLSIRAVGYELE